MPQLALVQHKQTNSKHPGGQWVVYLGNAVCIMAITLKSASGVCSQHSFCVKTCGILSSLLQAMVSTAIGHGSGWVPYSFASDCKHFACLWSISSPATLSTLRVSSHQVPALVSLWAKEKPRCLLQCKSFRRCSVTSLLSQAFKREYITGRGKSAVSSAFRLCLNDKMEEELSSIWTVLIVAGLSAVLQARRFSSSAGEEKHICHNTLGLLSAVRGVWIETLGWWGCVVRWLLPFLAPWHTSEDYRQKKNHSAALQRALVVLKECSWREPA